MGRRSLVYVLGTQKTGEGQVSTPVPSAVGGETGVLSHRTWYVGDGVSGFPLFSRALTRQGWGLCLL